MRTARAPYSDWESMSPSIKARMCSNKQDWSANNETISLRLLNRTLQRSAHERPLIQGFTS